MADKKFEMSDKLQAQIAHAKALQKDIDTARGVVNNALKQYIKRKIGARNKAQVEEQEAFFAPLKDYSSKIDLQNAYGYEMITEAEYDRLCAMWDAREVAQQNAGQYTDRVVEMIEIAIRSIGDQYLDEIDEAAKAKKHFEDDVKRIQRENAERDWERKHGLRI